MDKAERKDALRKADGLEKMSFEVSTTDTVSMVYKADDEFFIWGPASVEIVDKENDKIRVDALEKALPQLLKRARLSYAHTDQIVGRILDGFETKSPVEVEIDGDTFERSDFPTEVLDLDDTDAPALYVAGEVYNDTEQARDVREKIQDGEIDSYSISGEALVTRKQVENDQVYDDILELDLSAVTLCEEGMNQGAKFAQVTGEVDEVEFADPESEAEKSYSVKRGDVESPDRTQQLETATMSKSDNDSDAKSDTAGSLPDDAATKAFVEEKLEKQFEEQFLKRFDVHFARKSETLTDALVDALTEEFEKAIDERTSEVEERLAEKYDEQIAEQVSNSFPEADLATKGYIDDVVEEVVEEKLADDGEEKEDHDGEDEEGDRDEDKEGDYEDETGYSEEELKEALPSDMFEVVSEYLGKETETQTTEKSGASSELEETVEKLLSGDGVDTPAIETEEEDQYNQEVNKEDSNEGGENSGSPALNNFKHR